MVDSRARTTIWQVLIGTLLLVIIVSLLLPAIQFMRHSARTNACTHNLFRIGLAMHNYLASHEFFPPGVITASKPGKQDCLYVATSDSCDVPNSAQTSGLTMLLPLLNESETYQAFNMSLAACSDANQTAASRVVSTFLCPMNQHANRRVNTSYFPSPPGSTDYALSVGATGFLARARPGGNGHYGDEGAYPNRYQRAMGAFYLNSSTNERHFRDGMQHSLLMGEAASGTFSIAGPPLYDLKDRPVTIPTTLKVEQAWSQGHLGSNTVGATGSVFAATSLDKPHPWLDDKFTSSYPEMNLPPIASTDRSLGVQLTSYPYSIGVTGLTYTQPEHDLILLGGIAFDSRHFRISGFRSRHDGELAFLFGDGSVRLVKTPIDPQIYRAISTIRGQENFTLPPD